MEFSLIGQANSSAEGTIKSGSNHVDFGVNKDSHLFSPADLLIASFAACCLKNVERFSEFMHYKYVHASIQVTAHRVENPPKIQSLKFTLNIQTQDPVNTDLLLRNLSKYGTIYNTLKQTCEIDGEILLT